MSPDVAATAVAGSAVGVALLPILLFAFLGFFALGLTAFWIWILVDCATKEPDTGNDKVVWILILIFTHWIGALIYLLVRRPERKKKYGV